MFSAVSDFQCIYSEINLLMNRDSIVEGIHWNDNFPFWVVDKVIRVGVEVSVENFLVSRRTLYWYMELLQ